MLRYVTRLANSDTIKARMCACCDAVFTDVHCWQRHVGAEIDDSIYEGMGHSARAGNEIQLYTFGTLIDYAKKDGEGFAASFSLSLFKKRYAEGLGNPFENAPELRDGEGDWQIRLKGLEHTGFDGYLLCNPEDLVRCDRC